MKISLQKKMIENFVEVRTEYGKIRGRKRLSVFGREFFSFQKIPYMKAPVGKLRFVDPQPPEKWSGTLDCTEEGPAFPNLFFLDQQYQGNLEDGVHINVYTNNFNPNKPVLVWIHGGGIYTGSASESITGSDYLMQKDVVLVTFQYRMGVFGFLSLEDPTLNIPGNAQFRDHIFALKWIQRNIKNFGGDANNVTLFGESWGGGATSYHLISNKSKGLFHRAILMSGTALNNYYSYFPTRNWALRLCVKLGYDKATSTDKEILDFLENADEKEIVIASTQILTEKEKNDEGFNLAFGPVIEPYDNGNGFLTDDIIKMMRKGWGKDIDIIIGNTKNECIGIPMMMKTEELFKSLCSFQRYVPRDLELGVDNDKKIEYGELVKKNYFGEIEPSLENMTPFSYIYNDYYCIHPMYRTIMSRLTFGKGKTFVYCFNYNTQNNLMKKFFKFDVDEAIHADDNSYIFKMPGMEGEDFNLSIDSHEFEGIKMMTGIFADFSKNGNPNFEMLNNAEWTPATKEEPFKALYLSEKKCEMINLVDDLERIKIFNQFYEEQNQTLY